MTRMRKARMDLGLKTSELGELVGVSKTTISCVENGRNGTRKSYRQAIADVLGHDEEFLFDAAGKAILLDGAPPEVEPANAEWVRLDEAANMAGVDPGTFGDWVISSANGEGLLKLEVREDGLFYFDPQSVANRAQQVPDRQRNESIFQKTRLRLLSIGSTHSEFEDEFFDSIHIREAYRKFLEYKRRDNGRSI